MHSKPEGVDLHERGLHERGQSLNCEYGIIQY